MVALLIAGGTLLLVGAELLVRGAARIAAVASVPPLIIGLTVVAFGTSAPEMAVSVGATFSDQHGIAVANVVGSNIFNVLFILGISALIVPLKVERQLVRLDVPVMIFVSVLLLGISVDGSLNRFDGVLLFIGIILYVVFLARQGRAEPVPVPLNSVVTLARTRLDVARLIIISAVTALIGLALLVIGSRMFLDGAVGMARALGVSEVVIGLTIIAAGTSLPELATSLLASIRGERDIAVGNVVGSNIFNILAILGVCGILGPQGVVIDRSFIVFDIPIMIAVAVATLPIFFTGFRISRGEGLLFLAYYVAYTMYLVLDATKHDALAAYGSTLRVAVPLTLVTLLLHALRGARKDRA